jgi:hypothetical protein
MELYSPTKPICYAVLARTYMLETHWTTSWIVCIATRQLPQRLVLPHDLNSAWYGETEGWF